MRIDVLTIFPEMVTSFAEHSLLGRAQRASLLDLRVHDLRAATTDVHRSVDDAPFGGGAGMVLTPGPIFDTVERGSRHVRCSCSVPAVGAWTSRSPASWRAAGLLTAVRPLRGGG